MHNDQTDKNIGVMAKQENKEREYDLRERTAKFGEEVIRFVQTIARTEITGPLIKQLVRSSTSLGANYCEAEEGVSKREFKKYIGICRREASETKHWLRMIATAEPQDKIKPRELWQEAKELHLIFAKIFNSTKTGKNKEQKGL